MWTHRIALSLSTPLSGTREEPPVLSPVGPWEWRTIQIPAQPDDFPISDGTLRPFRLVERHRWN